MRLRAKVDRNQSEMVRQLRALGVFVWITHRLGNGFPDLLAVARGRAVLLEVKDPNQVPSKRKLTPDEEAFFASYPGPIAVVHTLEEALVALQLRPLPTRKDKP